MVSLATLRRDSAALSGGDKITWVGSSTSTCDPTGSCGDAAARAVIKDMPPIDADLNDLEKLILAKTVFIRCRGLFAEAASRRAFCV